MASNINLRKIAILALIFAATLSVQAEQRAIGSWRTHLAYINTQVIAQTPDKVYGVSAGALYSVDKDDDAVELLSKITGLNDNTVSTIAYSAATKTLVVGYANANIDLLCDGDVYNITDLYRKNMAGSKNINQIFCSGKYAYLACDFGILVLDLERREVADTYIIGDNGDKVAVLTITQNDGKWYATTANAIFTAPTSGKNLANFENWTKIATATTSKITNKCAVAYNDALYLLQSDSTVYRQKGSDWNKIYTDIVGLNSENDRLFICAEHNFQMLTPQNSETFYNDGICMASYDSINNQIWAAANLAGIARITPNTKEVNIYRPNGPQTNYAWRIRYSDGRIFVVPGGRWASQYQRAGHVMIFEDNTWINITQNNINAITKQEHTSKYINATDFTDVAIDPSDKKHFFVTSYGLGLYEFRNDQPYKLYNADNSDVETIFPLRKPESAYYKYHRLDGLTYDKNGNLWFLNMPSSSAVKLIKYREPDGTIRVLNFNGLQQIETAQDIIISNQDENQKWVLIPREQSNSTTVLFTFYDNGTPSKTSDDVTRTFKSFTDQDGNKYAPSNFRCIAQDQDNRLWIGSTDGICVLSNQLKAFEDGFTCSRVKIPRNDGTNLADYLLDGIQINAIAVDGSNRKWIGTETNGVFLVSEDGLETIHHFTSENSPLLSDNIISIGINDKTGEVFFGTGNGLISYQSDASEGNEQFTNVHAFPNPVREDYTGIITITGLITDTRVKITDIAGNVVYETISNGGIATWDGNRSNGERVATGIYLAMCFSPDGKQHETTKILIINR